VTEPRDHDSIPAGDFGAWLDDMELALRGGRDADVPCGTCTACCTSSQFVHIAPDERDTLAVIPPELLFPAPRAPKGHVILGYDEHGRCPMLIDGRCSIYAHRPRTCRTYDCRVLSAAGVDVSSDKPLVAGRADRWRFSYPDTIDRTAHDAVRAAARFLQDEGDTLSPGTIPTSPTQRAVLAVEIHRAFLHRGPDPRAVQVEIDRRRPRPASR
jgi:hypothetical protein